MCSYIKYPVTEAIDEINHDLDIREAKRHIHEMKVLSPLLPNFFGGSLTALFVVPISGTILRAGESQRWHGASVRTFSIYAVRFWPLRNLCRRLLLNVQVLGYVIRHRGENVTAFHLHRVRRACAVLRILCVVCLVQLYFLPILNVAMN